jgi:hypothetical protein
LTKDSKNEPSVKACIFCKSELATVGRAREHIVPQWLQREWNFGDDVIEPAHFDAKMNLISKRTHTFNSFLAGHVCAPCNNGWMAALEGKCKSLILDLACGSRRILDLSDSEALLIARWAVKTCFVLHTAANWRRVVPASHIFKLDTDSYKLPDRVMVIGHTYKGSSEFSWSQSTMWQIYFNNYVLSDSDVETVKTDGYKIGLRLGGLFLAVAHNPLPWARICLWKRRHVPLYPRWSYPVAWQVKDVAWPKKADVRFHTFMYTLSLSIDTNDPRLPPCPSSNIRQS